MSNTHIAPRRRILALIAALGLGLAACGADETIDAGAGATPTNDTTAEEQPIEEDVSPEPGDEPPPDATEGVTRLAPRTDLVSLEPVSPSEILPDPSNDRQILVRFQGAAEPCSGAAVTVTETDTEITVVLETGLDPNAAAMSCIAQVFDYEIVIALDAPLGERTINA